VHDFPTLLCKKRIQYNWQIRGLEKFSHIGLNEPRDLNQYKIAIHRSYCTAAPTLKSNCRSDLIF
jgi:hypothetical protein